MAVPIPRVSVGVTNIRRKLAFASTPSIPPAPLVNDPTQQALGLFAPPTKEKLSARRILAGQTVGIPSVHGEVPQVIVIGIHVSALRRGSHSSTLSPSPFGFPKTEGSEPGARGAQFTGKLIHDPQPNPQDIPSARFFMIVLSSAAD